MKLEDDTGSKFFRDIKMTIDVTYVNKAKELNDAEEAAKKARLAKEEELRVQKEKEKKEDLNAEKKRAEEEKKVTFTLNWNKTKSEQTKTLNRVPVIYPRRSLEPSERGTGCRLRRRR